MRKSYKRVLLSALVALAPMFSACERAEQINSVETQVAAAPGKAKKVHPVYVNSTASGTVWGMATHGKDLVLEVAGFRLEIPKGAVKQPTIFTMTAIPGDMVKVSLTASSGWNEVRTFLRPLTLTMPLSAVPAEEIASGKLVIGNIAEDGSHTFLDVTRATVDPSGQFITGLITHFSEWVVAKDVTILID